MRRAAKHARVTVAHRSKARQASQLVHVTHPSPDFWGQDGNRRYPQSCSSEDPFSLASVTHSVAAEWKMR